MTKNYSLFSEQIENISKITLTLQSSISKWRATQNIVIIQIIFYLNILFHDSTLKIKN